MNLREFECGIEFEWRHDRRETFRQHRLSRSRWTNQQDVVSAGARDLQRAFRRNLAAYLFEVDVEMLCLRENLRRLNAQRRWRRFRTQLGDQFYGAAKIR